jgi:hypothetical protein
MDTAETQLPEHFHGRDESRTEEKTPKKVSTKSICGETDR